MKKNTNYKNSFNFSLKKPHKYYNIFLMCEYLLQVEMLRRSTEQRHEPELSPEVRSVSLVPHGAL